MDLNARPTRNFWDIFHCCRNIGEGENDENPTKFSATNNYAFMKFLDTKGTDMMNTSAADSVNTPTTVATADFSFDSEDSKLETITEDDNIFDDDLSEVAMEETEQQNSESEKEADFNEQDASFIYDKMTNLAEQQDDDMPDMDSYLNDDGNTKTTKDDTATQQCNQTAAGEVTFYHFFIFMILRHIFGPLLVGVSIKKKKNVSHWEKFLSFTNCSSIDKDDDEKPSKESVRTMKLRQLKLDEGKCEVYPSLSDVPPILEDEILL